MRVRLTRESFEVIRCFLPHIFRISKRPLEYLNPKRICAHGHFFREISNFRDCEEYKDFDIFKLHHMTNEKVL